MASQKYYNTAPYSDDPDDTSYHGVRALSPPPHRELAASSVSAPLLSQTYTPYHPSMDTERQIDGTSTPPYDRDQTQGVYIGSTSSLVQLKGGAESKVADVYELQTSSRAPSPLPGAQSYPSQEENEKVKALQHGEEDEIEYPTGIKFVVITASLCLAVFLMALDNTIIATAIPKITDEFKSLDDVGWYASSYLLTTCALQLFFGKLYTFYSVKWTFLISIGIFEVGSLVCGVAPDSLSLIVGRAVAGIGSAGLFCGALVIIAYTVPMAKRPAYTGIIGACYGIASIAGPLLGGAFTDGPGWRWCFYINLPLGAITLVVITLFFKSPHRKSEQKVSLMTRFRQLDIIGTVIFIVDVVVVLLALQWGGATYAWNSWRIILLFVVFGVLTVAFIALQWYMKEDATLPFNIISQRSVAAACAWAFLLGAAFFILIYWVPIWFQAVKGASALMSGIYCLPMVLALVIANAITGGGTSAIGYYNPFYYASVVLSCIGAGLLTTWTVDEPTGKWIGYQIIYGFGVGFGMQQAIITVQAVLPIKDIPVGTAMAAFFMNFGGSLFVSAAQNVFNNKLITELPKYAPGVNPTVILHVGATELKDAVAPNMIAGVLEAYNTAVTNTWYIAVAMCVLTAIPAIFVEWKSVKGMQAGGLAA